LAFKIIAILHNKLLAMFIKLLETVSKGVLRNRSQNHCHTFLDCRHICKTCTFHYALQAGKQKEFHCTPLIWHLLAPDQGSMVVVSYTPVLCSSTIMSARTVPSYVPCVCGMCSLDYNMTFSQPHNKFWLLVSKQKTPQLTKIIPNTFNKLTIWYNARHKLFTQYQCLCVIDRVL
jgi:hypothetical protein